MIEQSFVTSAKQAALTALVTGGLKMALYTASADLTASTTDYTMSGEVVGTGYTAGGKSLSGVTVATSGTTAYLTFDNPVWNPASFTARAALIYNISTGKVLAVLDFGADKTATTTFTVQVPAATPTSAIIRIA